MYIEPPRLFSSVGISGSGSSSLCIAGARINTSLC